MRKKLGIVMTAAGAGVFVALLVLRALGVVRPVSGGFLQEIVLSEALGLPLAMPFTLSALLAGAGVFLAARRAMARVRELMIFLIVLAAFAFMADASEVFLGWTNLSAILLAVSLQAIIAIGMTVLLVSGGFDLSVGATAGLAGAAAALVLTRLCPALPGPAVLGVVLALLVGLATGASVGAANGLIVARVGINPFITTLGMMQIVRGLLLLVTNGKNVSDLPTAFTVIGQGGLVLPGGARIQFPILISLVLVAAGDVLLRRSRFFRQNYYLGGNEKAAILSGIRVDRIKIFNYTLTGLLAAAAGVIMTARLGSASVTAGVGLELQVITAVIIGGASLQGGEGTVLGAFLGSILMAIILSALTLLGINTNAQELIIGATLLLAVLADTLGKKRRGAL
ncbi:MAG: ABC transporter permease [Planctomycetota bacterium]|nr:ABC transporter permease [Planctomycetota bacterium]